MNDSDLYNNMLSGLIDDLGHLASVTIQDRYIVNGTKDSYLTADDLLEDLDSTLLFFRAERFPERIGKLEKQMGPSAFKQLLELERVIKKNTAFLEHYTFNTIIELIHGDPVWENIRSMAKNILRAMSIDLEHWEKDHA